MELPRLRTASVLCNERTSIQGSNPSLNDDELDNLWSVLYTMRKGAYLIILFLLTGRVSRESGLRNRTSHRRQDIQGFPLNRYL